MGKQHWLNVFQKEAVDHVVPIKEQIDERWPNATVGEGHGCNSPIKLMSLLCDKIVGSWRLYFNAETNRSAATKANFAVSCD